MGNNFVFNQLLQANKLSGPLFSEKFKLSIINQNQKISLKKKPFANHSEYFFSRFESELNAEEIRNVSLTITDRLQYINHSEQHGDETIFFSGYSVDKIGEDELKIVVFIDPSYIVEQRGGNNGQVLFEIEKSIFRSLVLMEHSYTEIKPDQIDILSQEYLNRYTFDQSKSPLILETRL